MPKTTYQAHTDIAFVKYWGKKDEILRLPENGSISMKLSELYSTTTVDFLPDLTEDQVEINGEQEEGEASRVIKHLDRIRALAAAEELPLAHHKAKVVSENNFPTASGLSSSGSGFAALTLAATKAIGLALSAKELSILARQGSGSACRSVCGGYVEWKDGSTSDTSFSETIFPADHFDIRDIVAIVDPGAKIVSTTEGHTAAQTSLMFKPRQAAIAAKIEAVKKALAEKDFSKLGQLIEAEALEFHSVLLTSHPAFIALKPGTVEVMNAVQRLRAEGLECYFTINTGHNIHVLTLPEYEAKVQAAIEALSLVQQTLASKVAGEPTELSDHLF